MVDEKLQIIIIEYILHTCHLLLPVIIVVTINVFSSICFIIAACRK